MVGFLIHMNKISKVSLILGIIGLILFFIMHILIYTELIPVTENVIHFSFFSKGFIVLNLLIFINEYLKKIKRLNENPNIVKN